MFLFFLRKWIEKNVRIFCPRPRTLYSFNIFIWLLVYRKLNKWRQIIWIVSTKFNQVCKFKHTGRCHVPNESHWIYASNNHTFFSPVLQWLVTFLFYYYTSNQMKPSRVVRFKWLNNILSARCSYIYMLEYICVPLFFPHLFSQSSITSRSLYECVLFCYVAPGPLLIWKIEKKKPVVNTGNINITHLYTINNMQIHFPSSLYQSCSIEHSNVDKCVFPFLFYMCRWCITNAL